MYILVTPRTPNVQVVGFFKKGQVKPYTQSPQGDIGGMKEYELGKRSILLYFYTFLLSYFWSGVTD